MAHQQIEEQAKLLTHLCCEIFKAAPQPEFEGDGDYRIIEMIGNFSPEFFLSTVKALFPNWKLLQVWQPEKTEEF